MELLFPAVLLAALIWGAVAARERYHELVYEETQEQYELFD